MGVSNHLDTNAARRHSDSPSQRPLNNYVASDGSKEGLRWRWRWRWGTEVDQATRQVPGEHSLSRVIKIEDILLECYESPGRTENTLPFCCNGHKLCHS